MPGRPFNTSQQDKQGNTNLAAHVNGFRAENELRDLQFKLTHKLQSTLDVINTLEHFFHNISETVKLDGMQFETQGEAPFEVGKNASHSAQYNIKGPKAILGTLTFFRRSHFLEGELAALEMFVGILFFPLRNALLYRDALACSLRDTLTGIGNRKAMDLAFSREIKLAQRHKHPLCLLFIDLDNFKKINDNYGHRAGDKLLQHAVTGIQTALRETDQVFRYGGEEFVVLLNNTELNAAKLIAERIRLYIAMTALTVNKQELTATVSIGVSTLGPHDTSDSLLTRTDSALYIAKNSGKNKVICLGTKVVPNSESKAAG